MKIAQNIEQSNPKPRIESISDMIFWWFALSIGTLFRKAGIIPAYQISKLKPVDARYE